METETSRMEDEEMIAGEGGARIRNIRQGSSASTTATVLYMDRSTSDDYGKMPLPYRVVPFIQSLPIGGEYVSTADKLIKGRPPKLLKTIPRSAFKNYQMRFKDKPFKVRPDLLELRSQYLTEVTGIEKYFHIYYLDLTYNKIPTEGLRTLKYMQNLITLILDHNKLLSTTIPVLTNLEYLSINKNLLKKIDKFNQPSLMHVYLDENQIKHIKNVDVNSLPNLYTLSICRCQLASMMTNYAPSLRRLYLSNNNISKIQGISHLPNLEVLHLRTNHIQKLNGFSQLLKKLFYINLRENEIEDKKELKKIKQLPLLRIFILSENPIEEDLGDELRKEILLQIPDMRRINKFIVDDEEEAAARQEIEKKQVAAEKRRLRLERLRALGEIGEELGEFPDDDAD